MISTATLPKSTRLHKMEYIRSIDSLARKVDRSQEGFFGPQSMHWKIYREPIVILIAHSALLLQIAHPAVGQGVLDYSRFRKAYKVRAWATMKKMSILYFGSVSLVKKICLRLFDMHNRFQGTYTTADGIVRHYCAADPEYLQWVLMTLVERSIYSYETFVNKLSHQEKELYFQESCALATLMGIPPGHYPTTLEEMMQEYHSILSTELVPSLEVKQLADEVLKGPFYSLQKLNRFFCAGFLPTVLRQRFEFTWDDSQQIKFDKRTKQLQKIYRLSPKFLRCAPQYHLVMLRSRWIRLSLWLGGKRKIERN